MKFPHSVADSDVGDGEKHTKNLSFKKYKYLILNKIKSMERGILGAM